MQFMQEGGKDGCWYIFFRSNYLSTVQDSDPFLFIREGRRRVAGGRPGAPSGRQASRRCGGGAASWMVGGAGRRRGGGDGAGPWITLLTPWAGRSTKLQGKV
jgi:hypothetical protein